MSDAEPNLSSIIATGDGMFFIDQEQKITFWNKAAEGFLGYRAEEVIGKYCWELLQGCTLQGQVICRARGPIISQTTQGNRVRHFDLCVRHHDGHTILINLSTIALTNEKGGEPQGLLHLFYPLREQPAWSGMLRIYLLGPVQVQRADGSMVEGPLWNRVKVRALLAYLALQERQPVEREILLELLWPELLHDAALRNLNTTVYDLRRSLEPELASASHSRYVFYEGGQYWLGGAGLHWLDTRAFQGEIRRARVESDMARAVSAYRKALALYRSDYLADLSVTSLWSPGDQQRYQELYLAALEELGTIYEQQGLDKEAKEAYLQAIASAPWRETAVRKLMRLLIQQGDKVGAIRQCQRLTAVLENELGVKPSKETRLLCQELKCEP